jgi:conjugative relaxase-like TrwC/TraI family protein
MRPWNITSDDAEDYYYELDPFFGTKDNSEWQGGLAKKLSLQGSIAEEQFINLINGNDLNGHQVIKDGVSKDGENQHRAGVDVPFGAPKSVSIMALHCGDKRLLKAHRQAVASTIDYVERNFLYARKTVGGNTRAVLTGLGLFAKFDHSTSRANDPHLHTHSLTINMTQTIDGFRAVMNDQIFKHQTLLNSIYQSYLAKLVRDLDYGIEQKSKGQWEIAGVKDEWIETFSKRKNEIDVAEEALQSDEDMKDLDPAKIRDRAQRDSRAKKDVRISRDELLKLWEDQVPRQQIISSVERRKLSAREIEIDASECIRTAYNAIHESESTFSKSNVVDVALRLCRGKYTIDDMENEFDATVDIGEIEHLVTLKNKLGIATKVFTSEQMRKVEQGILEMFNAHGDALVSDLDPDLVDRFVDSNFDYLNSDQRQLVNHVLLSPGQFSIIQGDAGTGKTTALTAVNSFVCDLVNHDGENIRADSFICPGKNIELAGLAFTGKAASELQDKSGIQSYTLHKFLNHEFTQTDPSKSSIWIVDESSMVGSLQLDQLLKEAMVQNAKVVLVGDCKQLQAITAGKMFKDLQRYGHIKPLHMKQVLRQKSDHLKKVVGYVTNYIEGDDADGIKKAFGVLLDLEAVSFIKKKADLIQRVVDKYLSYDSLNDCLVVTPLNEDRIETNQIIHDMLFDKSSDEFEYDIKAPVSMVGTERYFAVNYKAGYKVFVGESKVANLKPGQQLTIRAVDMDRNTITIGDDETDDIVIDLRNNDVQLSVYEEAQRRFCVGEKIVFTKNDDLIGVDNGVTATIERIHASGMITVLIDGSDKHIKFNPYQYAYFDYGYCVTGHKSQGQTNNDVVFFTSSNSLMNNAEMFYVAMTRAQYNAYFYANDEKILEELQRLQSKSSVLDAILRDRPDQRNNHDEHERMIN